ncbi:CARDB domain-containing protein [Methanothermobacter sp.]|uniref:CARDB domain-containing protein n=1 Tax=Methanothermobacter sp. TaxID=1884223 RepID=UPI003C73D8F5
MKIYALILVLLIAGVSAGFYLFTQTGSTYNREVKNLSEKNDTAGSARIIATQTGPESAKPGSDITLKCRIRNDGTGPARNVKVTSQDFERSFDVIGAGEEVEFQVQIHIPTEEEVKIDFGEDAKLSNPFFIGGFSVTYTDSSGKHSLNSNSLEIPLQI